MVKCSECGFFGKHEREESVSVCYEATPHDREVCTFAQVRGHISVFPCCFLGKKKFSWDFYGKPDFTKLNSEIHEDQNCQYWFPYTEFRNPQQHYEEYKMMQLEQSRKDFELRMETDRRNFELKLQDINSAEKKRTDRIMIWLTFAGIFFALAQVFVALASLTSDSLLFKWFH